ncbi:hypothetical protein WDU94_011077 [Cyamophila willieti]
MELSKIKKDELFLERLELMNEYIVHKYQLETLVKSGCLHLAKARYVERRTNYISTLQLPTSDTTKDIKALYHVKIREDSTSNKNDTDELEIDKENDTNKDNLSAPKGKTENVVRSTCTKSNSSNFELIKDEKEAKENNPLKWFGVLVPQSLKSAQTDFEKCIELSIHIANLQLKLQTLNDKLG